MLSSPAAPAASEPANRLTGYVLLAVVVLILGCNWPLLAIGMQSLSPLWMAALRLLGALIVMLALTALTGNLRRPTRNDLPLVWSVGTVRMSLVTLMVFIALEFVPPGRSSVLVWTASLWTVPLAAALLHERMTLLRWGGLASGIVGIVVLVEPWRITWDGTTVVGHVLLLAAAVLNAGTSVHIRAHGWVASPFQLMPWQLLVGAVPMALVALAIDGLPRVDWTPELAGIVAYQGVLATSVAFWAQQTVLQRLPVTSTNLTLMTVPVVGLLSSVVVVGEQVTPAVLAGLVLIIGGVGTNIVADTAL